MSLGSFLKSRIETRFEIEDKTKLSLNAFFGVNQSDFEHLCDRERHKGAAGQRVAYLPRSTIDSRVKAVTRDEERDHLLRSH
ncbi:hypothetical protein OUZ56_015815 [Daphnia magna]|uniref:Uncharacterized protein n=1 Tax=Daphnia magna TaxID=35525 RepID=A0ABR0ANU6_9CRUS|nr:hypothetical protein OUZ56_015815 [Daphnia magna]